MRWMNPDYIPSIGVEYRNPLDACEGERTFSVPDRPILRYEDKTLWINCGEGRTLSSMWKQCVETAKDLRSDGRVINRVVVFLTSAATDEDYLFLQNKGFSRDISLESRTCMLAWVKKKGN